MSNSTLPKKNSFIELNRFLVALILIVHHSFELHPGTNQYHFVGAWIFVEYFFILTGYFTTKHFAKREIAYDNIEQTAFIYTIKKLSKTLPFACLGVLIDVFYNCNVNNWDLSAVTKIITQAPINMMLLSSSELPRITLNSPLWYLSALLLTLPLLILIMTKYAKLYTYYLCWIIPIILYSFMQTTNGTMSYWGTDSWQIAVFCFARAISALMIGSIVFYLSRYLKQIKINRFVAMLSTPIELLCLIILVTLAFVTDGIYCTMFSILLIVIIFICSFSGLSLTSRINNRFFNYLGTLSLPIYCIHRPIEAMIQYYMPFTYYIHKLLITFPIVLILSVLTTFLFSLSKRRNTTKQL